MGEALSKYAGLPEGLGERLDNLPTEPGVYIMKNRRGEVIYVGKAVSLRARVRSYFGVGDGRAFVALLGKLLGDVQTIVVRSETEALLLEQQLIKQHKPRFNIIHRDDKSFITLCLNEKGPWPRLEVMRTHTLLQEGHQKDYRYFGPYSSASSVRATLRVINHHFMLRTCTDHTLNHRTRPCLEYQIGRCLGPCVFEVSAAAYQEHVEDALLFLEGRRHTLVASLKGRMDDAATALRFEDAARLRDQMLDVERTMEKQVVTDSDGADLDVLGLHRLGSTAALALLQVRTGRVMGQDVLTFKDAELPDDELLLQVLDARYGDKAAQDIPAWVLLPCPIPEDERLARAAHLTQRRGAKVEVYAPQRGDKAALVDIANRNAQAALQEKENKEELRRNAVTRLQERLRLSQRPRVMECFDVSLFQGAQPVASQVTFVDGLPEKSQYKRYIIKTVTGTDDFAMLHEVVTRRLVRALAQGDWPQLMVMDGGRGQLNAACAAFKDLGVPMTAAQAQQWSMQLKEDGTPRWHDAQRYVELCSLAKARALDGDGRRGYSGRAKVTTATPLVEAWDEGGEDGAARHSPERVFLPEVKDPLALRLNSAELHLMTQLRDEAHRFAITFHRQRRKKSTLKSALDELPGVGPARRKALLVHLGSLTAVQAATAAQLAQVPGFSVRLAQQVWDALHPAVP